MESKPSGHIENWMLIGEGDRLRLVGLITKHHRLEGSREKLRTTSRITHLDTAAGVASTVNTNYTLGKPFKKEKDTTYANG
jgi:hypothetical protein